MKITEKVKSTNQGTTKKAETRARKILIQTENLLEQVGKNLEEMQQNQFLISKGCHIKYDFKTIHLKDNKKMVIKLELTAPKDI